MKCLPITACLLSLALLASIEAAEKRTMTAPDLWAMKRLGAPALSPDGKTVVFTVQEWSVDKNKSTANLWLVNTAGGSPRRLTTAQANDGAPAWSPDGRRIAFVSKRGDDETSALYVIPVDGGEAEEILEMPFALASPRWMPDGQQVLVGTSNEWGDKPFKDVMKATDVLLKKLPNLDPKRVAATGASYGGYLATWVLGHTDRFACIINHAGVNNSYSQFACDVPHGFAKVMGGTRWENVEGLQRNNPMFYARQFKTPTLVIHGELDYRVPYGNGLELYGILQAMGVPSRLVVYPNENHWILSPQNSIYWYWELTQFGSPRPKQITIQSRVRIKCNLHPSFLLEWV